MEPLSERIWKIVGEEGEVAVLVVHQDVLAKWAAEVTALESRIEELEKACGDALWLVGNDADRHRLVVLGHITARPTALTETLRVALGGPACPHLNTVPEMRGGRRLVEGQVDDDIYEVEVCKDCGADLATKQLAALAAKEET